MFVWVGHVDHKILVDLNIPPPDEILYKCLTGMVICTLIAVVPFHLALHLSLHCYYGVIVLLSTIDLTETVQSCVLSP